MKTIKLYEEPNGCLTKDGKLLADQIHQLLKTWVAASPREYDYREMTQVVLETTVKVMKDNIILTMPKRLLDHEEIFDDHGLLHKRIGA